MGTGAPAGVQHSYTPRPARGYPEVPYRLICGGYDEAPAVAGASVVEEECQWAQPPALPGDPSVLNEEPQAQLLTAFGLLIAKPEPMSEST